MNTMISLPIVAAVPTTAPAMPKANDVELQSAASAYIAALADYVRLMNLTIQHESQFIDSAGPAPAVLQVRPEDSGMGLGTWDGRNLWNAPCDVGPLRSFSGRCAKERARAAEIVDAYDQWQAARRRPPGVRKTKKALDRAAKLFDDLGAQVAETSAKSWEGLIAKSRCVDACEGSFDEDSTIVSIGKSIVQDILAMADRSAS